VGISAHDDLTVVRGLHALGGERDDPESPSGTHGRQHTFEVGDATVRSDVVEAAGVVDQVELPCWQRIAKHVHRGQGDRLWHRWSDLLQQGRRQVDALHDGSLLRKPPAVAASAAPDV
jgi:hypothetical protein